MSFIERLKLAWRILMGKDLRKGNFFENQDEIADKLQNISDNGVYGGATNFYGESGAIDVDSSFVMVGHPATPATLTLADGVNGQVIRFLSIQTGGAMNITPENFQGALTKVSLATAGQFLELVFDTNKWYVFNTDGTIS
jgi:hypothetical protein